MSLPEDKKILVIARDYLCFKLWCDRNRVSPRDRRIVYITDAYKMRGFAHNQIEIISVCDWNRQRPRAQAADISEMVSYYRSMGTTIHHTKCTP